MCTFIFLYLSYQPFLYIFFEWVFISYLLLFFVSPLLDLVLWWVKSLCLFFYLYSLLLPILSLNLKNARIALTVLAIIQILLSYPKVTWTYGIVSNIIGQYIYSNVGCTERKPWLTYPSSVSIHVCSKLTCAPVRNHTVLLTPALSPSMRHFIRPLVRFRNLSNTSFTICGQQHPVKRNSRLRFLLFPHVDINHNPSVAFKTGPSLITRAYQKVIHQSPGGSS